MKEKNTIEKKWKEERENSKEVRLSKEEMLKRKKEYLEKLFKEFPGTEKLNLLSSNREEPPEGFAILELSVKNPDGSSKKWLPYKEALKTYGIENVNLRRILPNEIDLDCDDVNVKEILKILDDIGILYEWWSTTPNTPYKHAHIRFRIIGLEKYSPNMRTLIKRRIISALRDSQFKTPDMVSMYPCRMTSIEWSKHHKRDEYLELIKKSNGIEMGLNEEILKDIETELKEYEDLKNVERKLPNIKAKWECPIIKNVLKFGNKQNFGTHRFTWIISAWLNNKGTPYEEALRILKEWNKKNIKKEPDAQIINQCKTVYENGITHITCDYMKRQGLCNIKKCKYEKKNLKSFKKLLEAPLIWEDSNITKKEAKDDEEKETSFFEKDGQIFEQIIDSDGKPKFITINNGEIKIVENVDNYTPINDNAIKFGAVLLPDKIEEYGDLKTLLKEVQDFIYKYLDVSPLFLKISSFYVLLSWVYDKLNTIPYLRALGDTGCGKTRFLDTIGRICYKPILISGAVRPAPIYRMINKWRGTVVIDEADFKDSDFYNEVITILNSGFERGKPVIRCEKDHPDEIEFFDPFCPKLIATRQKFKDKALESRCITEIMRETERKIPVNLPNEFYEEQKILRRKLLKFRLDYWNKISIEDIKNIDLGENIEPRLKQAMNPISILLMKDENLFKDFKKFLQKYQMELIEERSSSYDGMLVNSIYNLLKDEKTDISSSDIKNYMSDNYKVDTTSVTVGRHLKNLGLNLILKRTEGKVKRCVVIDEKILPKLFRRYITESVTDVTDVTDVTLHSAILLSEKLKNKAKTDTQKKLNTPQTPVTSVTSVTSVTNVAKNDIKNKVLELYPSKDPKSYFELETEAQKLGISPEEFEKIHEKLKKDGLIYEPRSGYYLRM